MQKEYLEAMEELASRAIPKGKRDAFTRTLNSLGIKREGRWAAALTAGKNYHSKVHIDPDTFFTFLGVLDGDGGTKFSQRVVHYFVFPNHNVYVELRSGDVILFNPLHYHSCTEQDPQVSEAWIFSGYLSMKTAAHQNRTHIHK